MPDEPTCLTDDSRRGSYTPPEILILARADAKTMVLGRPMTD